MWLLSNSFVIAALAFVAFLVAYHTYGRFLARTILGLDPARRTPAHCKSDGVDFVPTHPTVLFGHHFASIAGLGPIVGPAIAIVWGWGPAILWIVIGSILIGAVHDLTTLYASLRHEGRGLGDLTSEVIGRRARVLFLLIIFFLLALAMGVFALYMARLFTDLCPQAVLPTFALIAIAVVIGLLVYRRGWALGRVTLLGLALMLIILVVGMKLPVPLYRAFVQGEAVSVAIDALDDGSAGVEQDRGLFPRQAAAYFDQVVEGDPGKTGYGDRIRFAGQRAMSAWTYILLIYAFIASVLPVWLLLQPRDYINSYQLYIGLALILAGLLWWHPQIEPLPFARQGGATEPILPFLFITIACGAISGFHSLVSSGTTVRQIRNEAHAQIIGYGAMLTEGFLAVLVVLACVCGLGAERFGRYYGGGTVNGLAAFLDGAAVVVSKPFLWLAGFSTLSTETIELFFRSFIAVVVVSFAMTTLDSATRLLRFNVEEIGKVLHLPALQNRFAASAVAVAAIGFFAFMKINGRPAGMTLWQLFGTTNQLLAAIGLLVVSVMLYKMGKPLRYTLAPMGLMIASVGWAMVYKLREFYGGWVHRQDTGSMVLFFVGALLLLLAAWMVVEAFVAFRRYRRSRRLAAAS